MMKRSSLAELWNSLKHLSLKEICKYELQGIILVCVMGYFFYRSIVITLVALPLSVLYLLRQARQNKNSRQIQLQYQFKEVLVSVSGSVRAGYSLENAFYEAQKDMISFYGNKAAVVQELETVRKGLSNGKTLTALLGEMGKRTNVAMIKDFASVLVIGKQTGGNLVEIIDSFIHVAEDKVQVEQEIETIISSKKYEQKIMNCIPFLIIFYIDITSKGFFDVLYNNLFGKIVMTMCMVIYLSAIYMAERITDIQV